MKLYGYWRSSSSYRVRVALGLKGLAYESAPVHLLKDGGQQHAESFRAINPMAQVPVLEVEHEGRTVRLGQSIAILEYLEERFPAPALLPADPVLRARVRQLTEIVNSGIQPFQNLSVLQALDKHGVDSKAFAVDAIRKGLQAFTALAEPVAGAFSVGDAPTFAECVLVPQLYSARRFGIDVEADFPLLARIDARCAELEAVQAAHPDRQPDAA
jgi:maleylpyruvate isomerase